jgi:hypothetical protein
MKIHKPRHVASGFDLTKKFHVRNILVRSGPKILQGLRQRPLLRSRKIDRFLCAVRSEARRRRLGGRERQLVIDRAPFHVARFA